MNELHNVDPSVGSTRHLSSSQSSTGELKLLYTMLLPAMIHFTIKGVLGVVRYYMGNPSDDNPRYCGI